MIVTVQKCVANKGWRCGRLSPPPPLAVFEGQRGDGERERWCLVGCDGAPLSLFTHLFSSELTIKQ